MWFSIAAAKDASSRFALRCPGGAFRSSQTRRPGLEPGRRMTGGLISPIVPAAALLSECDARINVAIDASAGGSGHTFGIRPVGAIAWDAPTTALDAIRIIARRRGAGAGYRGSPDRHQSGHCQHRIAHDCSPMREFVPALKTMPPREGSGSRLSALRRT